MAKIIDAGAQASDEYLAKMEKKVASVYSEAASEMQKKTDKYFDGFTARDAKKQELVKAGELSEKKYLEWRKNQMLTGQRYRDMVDVLAKDATNADKIAMSIVNGYLPDVYATNFNYGTYQVEHVGSINTSFTLYDRHTVERLIKDDPDILPKPKVEIPKDYRWNKEHIVNQLTQGVLQGESVKTISKRMQKVTDMDKNAAMRNARTAVTGAQNAGRVDAYKRAEDMGIKMKQEWLAAHDGHTRESHAEVDGEQIEVGGTFSNGLAYPGDPGGAPEEVYNCRCTLMPALEKLGQIKGKENYRKSEYQNKLAEYHEDVSASKMSFSEWEKAHSKR